MDDAARDPLEDFVLYGAFSSLQSNLMEGSPPSECCDCPDKELLSRSGNSPELIAITAEKVVADVLQTPSVLDEIRREVAKRVSKAQHLLSRRPKK